MACNVKVYFTAWVIALTAKIIDRSRTTVTFKQRADQHCPLALGHWAIFPESNRTGSRFIAGMNPAQAVIAIGSNKFQTYVHVPCCSGGFPGYVERLPLLNLLPGTRTGNPYSRFDIPTIICLRRPCRIIFSRTFITTAACSATTGTTTSCTTTTGIATTCTTTP